MKVAVWDTYVKRKDGRIMHFDIMVPQEMKETTKVFGYGIEYLSKKGEEGQSLTMKECQFCHVEPAKDHWIPDIKKKGYFIFEMKNCD